MLNSNIAIFVIIVIIKRYINIKTSIFIIQIFSQFYIFYYWKWPISFKNDLFWNLGKKMYFCIFIKKQQNEKKIMTQIKYFCWLNESIYYICYINVLMISIIIKIQIFLLIFLYYGIIVIQYNNFISLIFFQLVYFTCLLSYWNGCYSARHLVGGHSFRYCKVINSLRTSSVF